MYKDYAYHLLSYGYQCVPIRPGSKGPVGLTGWQKELGEAAIKSHIDAGRGHWGVGINNINAIDVDVCNKEIADKIEDFIRRLKPNYLKRTGQAPKFLVPAHPNSDLHKKKVSLWKETTPSGEVTKHTIELLHKHQQQFVAYATHPDTQQPYIWYNSDPWRTPAKDLDVWTQGEFDELLAYFDSLCESAGFSRQYKNTNDIWSTTELKFLKNIPNHVPRDCTTNDMAAPHNLVSLERLQKLLDLLPMKYCDDRESWFRVGGIIYDVSGGSEEGRIMFNEWSKKSEKYDKTPGDTCDKKWADYTTKSGNAGVGTIVQWLIDEEISIPDEAPEITVEYTSEINQDLAAGTYDKTRMLKENIFVTVGSRVYNRDRRTVLKWEEFKKSHKASITAVRKQNGNKEYKETTDLWLRSKIRQTVDDVTYYPNMKKDVIVEDGIAYANTYMQPSLPDLKGEYDLAIIQPWLDHIQYMVPDQRQYNIVLDWLAHTIQYPHIRPTWAVLIVTPKFGVGKGALFELLKLCHGTHNTGVVEAEELEEQQFNGYLADTTIVLFDEVNAKGVTYKRLKSLVTSTSKLINPKYDRMRMRSLYCALLMFTNEPGALQIESGDRRFFVVESRVEAKSDPKYYVKLFNSLKDSSQTAAHFKAYLMARKIDPGFVMAPAPMTDAKRNMEDIAIPADQEAIESLVESREGPCNFDIITTTLIKEYLSDTVEISKRRIGEILNKYTEGKVLPVRKPYISKDVELPGHNKNLNTKRPHCKCIRNHDKWMSCGNAAIIREYLKAREATINSNQNVKTIEENVNNLMAPMLAE